MQEREKLESFWLCNIKGIGAASIRKLLKEAGSAGAVFKLPEERLKELLGENRADCLKRGLEEKHRKAVERRYDWLAEHGIFFLPCWDENFPERLRQLPDVPAFLYGRGRLPQEEKKAVAIIGARECSGYGREAAKYFAAGLAREGIVVVSGMARGVDGIAQTAALDAGGSSVAVLGCGVDICYPPENARLYEQLLQEGCLLSEYPPGTEPKASLFPPRNRIISGLSDLVLVTEARERSGTLITVDMALEQGRDVFAVPGRITDSCSRGCNRLIQNGAGMAVSVTQILEELKGMHVGQRAAERESGGRCSSDHPAERIGTLGARILKVLDCDPRSLDEIQRLITADEEGSKIPMSELMHELVLLCMQGAVENQAGMYFSKEGFKS